MLDHHIGKSIVYHLAFADSMRFSELKPDDIDNKLFNYHLKKVISEGYVIKTSDGHYALTPEGRRVGKGALKQQSRLIDRAYSVLLLAIRRKSDGSWLLYKRRTHPLLGMTGFMHAQPTPTASSIEVAAQECKIKTGLSGEFTVRGSGYFRVYQGDALESFTHFTLLGCDDIQGELEADNELAEYYWDSSPDFSNKDMLPNMQTLVGLYETNKLFFTEKTFHI
ncbi:MAG: hypothetical protein ABIQ04_01535 [Candidatus Saccharimonadales bacterium]